MPPYIASETPSQIQLNLDPGVLHIRRIARSCNGGLVVSANGYTLSLHRSSSKDLFRRTKKLCRLYAYRRPRRTRLHARLVLISRAQVAFDRYLLAQFVITIAMLERVQRTRRGVVAHGCCPSQHR